MTPELVHAIADAVVQVVGYVVTLGLSVVGIFWLLAAFNKDGT